MNNMFDQIDFGPLKPYLEDDDITDISYDNGGQVWLKTLSKGIFRIDNQAVNNTFMEKLAFQCSNVMGKTFNMAHPFLDAESAELRLAFVHESIAQNGIACVVRKTPAKIRLQKEKIVEDKYVELDIIDFLEQCVLGHCNTIVCGETGSGKTELVKYLASHIAEDEKIITIEDTLELHLDKIYPTRDIVSMKTNNIASYTDILEACMRQNPKWILLSEVRSAEAVLAVRNSISSGHYILSTIHADKASAIPTRMYSLLETNQDIDQFVKTINRYVQLGIYIRGYTDKVTHHFKREIAEVTEFYVTDDTNEAKYNVIYKKNPDGKVTRRNPTKYLIDYLETQGVFLPKEMQNLAGEEIEPNNFVKDDSVDNKQSTINEASNDNLDNSIDNYQNTNFVNQGDVNNDLIIDEKELNNNLNNNIDQNTNLNNEDINQNNELNTQGVYKDNNLSNDIYQNTNLNTENISQNNINDNQNNNLYDNVESLDVINNNDSSNMFNSGFTQATVNPNVYNNLNNDVLNQSNTLNNASQNIQTNEYKNTDNGVPEFNQTIYPQSETLEQNPKQKIYE